MTRPIDAARELIDVVADCLEAVSARGALIGGQAVNAWVEPRITLDIDVTVLSGPSSRDLLAELERAGFALLQSQGPDAASGPDFLRLRHGPSGIVVDIQVAKTDYESGVVARAASAPGLRIPVATPEDLVILKLIASRHKDQRDLTDLGAIPGLDWAYIEHWAPIWDVSDRLASLREVLAGQE